jgi:hypothetical protein
MDDFTGFAGLDAAYTDIIAKWVMSIRREFDAVLSWWNNLQRALDSDHGRQSRLHWPAGLASHPRFVGLFREHYFMVHRLNVERSLVDDTHEIVENDWIIDEEEEDELSGPISPRVLLLEMMESYAPDLWEHFRLFVYIPIGEDDELEVC